MSHQPERKEKDCLNCGAQVLGPYCQNCGQKNTVMHQTFWQLLTHFVYDVFHFDGKFFETLKFLLFKPGFVPKEYVRGRRFSYLDPIRMYLFTSALFFLVFFSVNNDFGNLNDSNELLSKEDRMEAMEELREELAQNPADSAAQAQFRRLQDTTTPVKASELAYDATGSFAVGDSIKNLQQYDSLQKALPKATRDNWLKQKLIKRSLAVYIKYGARPNEGVAQFTDLFLHKLPYLLFVSLPFFALLLKLLYARRNVYHYSDHAVFTLYHYIFSFILLLLGILLSTLAGWSHLKLFKYLIYALVIAWPVYLFIAMKRFYGQSRIKTFSKFLLLNLLGIIVLLLLFAVFVFFTFFQL